MEQPIISITPATKSKNRYRRSRRCQWINLTLIALLAAVGSVAYVSLRRAQIDQIAAMNAANAAASKQLAQLTSDTAAIRKKILATSDTKTQARLKQAASALQAIHGSKASNYSVEFVSELGTLPGHDGTLLGIVYMLPEVNDVRITEVIFIEEDKSRLLISERRENGAVGYVDRGVGRVRVGDMDTVTLWATDGTDPFLDLVVYMVTDHGLTLAPDVLPKGDGGSYWGLAFEYGGKLYSWFGSKCWEFALDKDGVIEQRPCEPPIRQAAGSNIVHIVVKEDQATGKLVFYVNGDRVPLAAKQGTFSNAEFRNAWWGDPPVLGPVKVAGTQFIDVEEGDKNMEGFNVLYPCASAVSAGTFSGPLLIRMTGSTSHLLVERKYTDSYVVELELADPAHP